MNSPVCWRKFEAECHQTNLLGDSKGANEYRIKLITDGTERTVLG